MWTHRAFGNPASGQQGSAAYNFNSGLNWKDILATPVINLSNGTPELHFDLICTSSLSTSPYRLNRMDTLFVIVSEDGATATTGHFKRSGIVCRIDTSTDFSSGPIHFSIDLTPFNTRSAVHIAFYAKDQAPSAGLGYFVYVDNVFVRKTNPADFAVLNFDSFRSYYFHHETYQTTAIVKNWGTTLQNNVPVILSFNDVAVDTAYISLPGGSQGLVTFNWIADFTGECQLKVKTYLSGDAVPDNDSLMRPVKFFPPNWTERFYDDFTYGTGQWTITNLSTFNGAIWQIFDASYPFYRLNEYCYTNVLAANDSADGTGWTHTSATFSTPISTRNMDSLYLEFDYDFATWIPPFFFDYCYIAGSKDNGISWDTLLTDTVSRRAAHRTLNISSLTGSDQVLLRFIYNESGGFNKWWAIDNVIIRGLTQGLDICDKTKPSKNFTLLGNYPNPFNPGTTVRFTLPDQRKVRIDIVNTLGQHVRTLFNGKLNSGNHQVYWDGRDHRGETVASGVYIYRIQANNQILSVKNDPNEMNILDRLYF